MIKEHLGYSIVNDNVCKRCKFCTQAQDRKLYCGIFPPTPFEVEPEANCVYFQEKGLNTL